MREPGVIDLAHAIARAEDKVNEKLLGKGFGQPVREDELRGIAGSREGVQSAITVRRTNEDIEVFGFRTIPCVNRQRKRTTNQERHLRPIKSGESMPIEAGGP